MHIVLLILKILGILLLVLLGLLLLVLLAVLFVPVRYQLQGMWKEDKWASVKVSWLLSVDVYKRQALYLLYHPLFKRALPQCAYGAAVS